MDEKDSAAEKKQKKKKPGAGTRRTALFLTLLLIVLAALAFVFRENLTADGLRGLFGRDGGAAAQGEAFTYEIGSGQVFAAAGNSLAVASSSAVQLLNAAGETVFKQAVSYDTPAAFASANTALFCDLGGTGCILVGMDGEGRTLSPAGALITASMNENGWFALVTEAAGYKALVSVYDAGGEPRYQWWSGSGYVLRTCVSPDNQLLAILCAETDGGKLHLFRLDSEAEQAGTEFPGELPFDLYFMGSDTLCAVSGDALSFLSADGAVKNRFDLGEYYLLDYDFGSQGFAAICVSAYRAAGGSLIETLDRDGRLLGYAETDRDVTSLSALGRQLLAMTSGGLTVYNQDMSVYYSHEGLMTAKKAVLRSGGDILLLSAYAAERLSF